MSGNRRKGQAASSSQAAELLQASGVNLTFLNNDTVNLIPSDFDTSSDVEQLIETIGLSVDPQLRIIFKKLTKRDVLTREKAVKELLLEIKSSELNIEKLMNAFPCFAGAYSGLVTDASSSIRAVTNNVLSAFLKVLKKEAGSHLKTVFPFLLFSISDGYNSVSTSAKNTFDDICTTPEKRQKALLAFAEISANIYLQIISLQHKLVQPQKFADIENDGARQARLIAQAINALTEVVKSVPELSDSVPVSFVNSTSFSNIMNMDDKVKAAAFNFLKVFIKAKPERITGTRIPSFILKELDSKDILLCRNAFECFLVAAEDPSFYETVKIEKAVVPKFVALVRRKHLHWHVLESSLLPSVSVVYDNLPNEEQKNKWLSTILDCFFEGIDDGFLLVPWVKAFSEVYRFAYVKAVAKLSEFLSQTFFKFLDIVISYDDAETTVTVVSLILWIDFKLYDDYDASDDFKDKLTVFFTNGLPNATKILESFFEDSDDQAFMFKLLLIETIPNDVFLRCFKLIDEDDVDLDKFGDIFKSRILHEPNDRIALSLMKELWDLICDGNIDGHLPYYVDFKNPRMSRLVMEIANEEVVNDFDDRAYNLLVTTALSQCFEEPSSLSPSVLGAFFKLSPNLASLSANIMNVIEASNEVLTIEGLLVVFEAVFISGNEKLAKKAGRNLFERLLSLFFDYFCENEDDYEASSAELKETLSAINHAAGSGFGAAFHSIWASAMLRLVDDNQRSISCENAIKLAELLGALRIRKKTYFELLISEVDVEKLYGQINQQFTFDLIATSTKSRFIPALITTSEPTPMTPLDLQHLTRRAVFFGKLAETFEEHFKNDQIEKGTLSSSLFYALLVEAAVEMQANRSMFRLQTDHDYLATFQELLNFIDRHFDSPIYDYRDFLASPSPNAYLFGLMLNDSQIVKLRPHVAVVAVPLSSPSTKNQVALDLLTKLEMADTAGTDAAVTFLETHVAEHRSEFEDWLFNVDSNGERIVVSAAFLRLLAKLISQGVTLNSSIHDFLLCGFVCAMQGITDILLTLKPGTRIHDFTALIGYFCLNIMECYESRVCSGDPLVNTVEWKDFYRPAALNHLTVWLAAIDPARKLLFPALFTNIITHVSTNISSKELVDAGLPQALTGSKCDPLDLTWKDYEPDVSTVLKLALRFIINVDEMNDAAKHFFGIHMLKNYLLDMFNVENPPRTPRSPGSIKDFTLEEQLFEPSVNEQKRLPALFRIMLSPADLNFSLKKCFVNYRTQQFNLFHKFFIWDSLIQFLSQLDIQTRAKYAASIEVPMIDNMLTLIFEAMPKILTVNYKLLSFQGALSIQQILTTPLSFQSEAPATTFEHYIINLFYRTTICLPSCVRTWYLGLPRSENQAVSVYSRLLAPIIIERELKSVGTVKLDRLTVKALTAVKEIVASYRFEDASVSLKIILPNDYPFSKATIYDERAIVTVELHRKLLKQLETFLNQQNGLMLDGILQWKRAIDNHLEGVEDCSICMSTVNASNYTLPQLQCRECKKKFHGQCLYKWFETSNAPTCPMCRHTFYN